MATAEVSTDGNWFFFGQGTLGKIVSVVILGAIIILGGLLGGLFAYFFGQGTLGNIVSGAILGTVIILGGLFAYFYKDSITNIIHTFGFNPMNIFMLLFTFGMGLFGYLFWLGLCKNKDGGKFVGKHKSITTLLTIMPLIASILLIFYPFIMILTNNISSWREHMPLVITCGFSIFFFSLYFFPKWHNWNKSGSCTDSGKDDFRIEVANFPPLFIFFVAAVYILAISFVFFYKLLSGKMNINKQAGILAMGKNFFVTLGLVLSNLFGGLNFFDKSKNSLYN